MRFTSIAGINRPVSRVVLGTEDYYLDQFDHHARILDAWISGGGNAIDTARMYATATGCPIRNWSSGSGWPNGQIAAKSR